MITKEIKQKIKDFSLKTDKEICGFLVRDQIFPCKNQSENPSHHFSISPLDYLRASYLGKIEIIYHSHTKNPEFSEFDKINLYNQKLRGLMYCKEKDCFRVFLPESYNNKYVGRSFEIGVSDCLSLVAGYYKEELGIILPEIKRKKGWYKENKNIVKENTPSNFKKISFEAAQKNDLLVFDMLNNDLPCHFGIYLGNDIILHQPREKLSTIEILTDAMKKRLSYALTWN